jgi:hypothetical protein
MLEGEPNETFPLPTQAVVDEGEEERRSCSPLLRLQLALRSSRLRDHSSQLLFVSGG